MRSAPCKPILLFIAMCCGAGVLNAQKMGSDTVPTVKLEESVSIQQSRVRLSGLVPASAKDLLGQAALSLDLGRAPEPGSFRVFTAEELKRKGVGRLRVQIPNKVVVHATGFPVEIGAVKRALARFSAWTPVSADVDVSLPLEIVTRSENPRFRISRVEAGGDAYSATAFVKCQVRADCGTFIARLRSKEPLRWATEKKAATVKHDFTEQVQASTQSLVRPGRTAFLMLDEAGFRITMPVLPLRRAAMGESVRVLDRAAHRIYLARVCGENQVIGHFEETK